MSFQFVSGQVIRKGSRPTHVSKAEVIKEYSLEQLEGKWQEIKRLSPNGKDSVGFSDSLLMNFYNGKVELRDEISMRMTMRGAAQVDAPNVLSVAGDIYNIRSLNQYKLVIDDGEFIRVLQKKDQFYYETFGKLSSSKDSFTVAVNIDNKNLVGKWLVYSRQAPPGTIKEKTSLIKSLDIHTVSDDGIATGEIAFYTTDITETFPCTLIIKDGNIQISADKYHWSFYTYKADGNEFIFGETGKLLYYTKRL